MRRLASIAVTAFVLLLAAAPVAHAQKRVALLIGNQGYSAEIGRLANPHNDIALLEKTLKGLQFEVTTVRDASLGTMHQAVNAYVRRVRAAGPDAIAFFYYAGHGAAADGNVNYLIPVDVKSAEEGDLWDVSLRLTEITRKLKAEAGNATHFVVFDACRNELKLRKAGTKSLVQARGFVPVAQESGMLIAYATAEGETASDVGSSAGPYSSVLAEEIIKPGVEAVTMFRNVQRRVRLAIKQEPYLGFNALGDVYLAGQAPPTSTAAQPSWANEAWTLVKDSNSIPALEAYVAKFGETFYADLARARIADLKQKAAAADAAAKKSDAEAVIKAADAERQRQALLKLEQDEKRQKALEAAGIAKPSKSSVPSPGAVFRDCADCPEMVVVPAGRFMMGSPTSEEGREAWDKGSEDPQRKVTIAQAFAVGRYEVTFVEWDACVSAGGCKQILNDQGWGRGKRPVIGVSWDEITSGYLPWLSRKTGKTYRLLTEAEWEYAARAGTTTPFSTGWTITTGQANFNGTSYGGSAKGASREKTVDVGTFQPNAFGLHDMHGNVWEWVEDCWHSSYRGAPPDGSAWTTSCTDNRRVLRGGSWLSDAQNLRAAVRGRFSQGDQVFSVGVGFRLARALVP